MSDEIMKLRLAADNPTVSAKWLEREQAIANREREFGLEQSLGKFRVGSVRALNAVPLTRGLESEVVYDVPSKLAQMLQRDELDAALVSVVEALFHDRYDILDGIAVASLGEVKSVFLAHRKPLAEVKEVFCDTASLTSVTLLKVLLAERGLKPEFKPLERLRGGPGKGFCPADRRSGAGFLFRERASTHARNLRSRRGLDRVDQTAVRLCRVGACAAGCIRPNSVGSCAKRATSASTRSTTSSAVAPNTRLEFRKDYLGWHIHYHLAADEKRGIAKFVELLRKHDLGPVFDPKFVVGQA
jgi:chorismate dehydratase